MFGANRFERVDRRRAACPGKPPGAARPGCCQAPVRTCQPSATRCSPPAAPDRRTLLTVRIERRADHLSRPAADFPHYASAGRVRPAVARVRRFACFCANPRAWPDASSATHPYTGSSIVYFCAGGPAVRDVSSQPLATRTGTSRSQSCRSLCLLRCSTRCARFCRFCW
jgi:hypothetical protein